MTEVIPGYRAASAPSGPEIALARPNLLGLAGLLLALLGVGSLVGTALAHSVIVAALAACVFASAAVLIVLGRRRSAVEYRLVLDARGVFLVNARGESLGILGQAPLTLTPGHYVYRGRYAAYLKQCVAVGPHFVVGTNDVGDVRYSIAVPEMPLPQYYLRASDWETLVRAVPQLAAIQ